MLRSRLKVIWQRYASPMEVLNVQLFKLQEQFFVSLCFRILDSRSVLDKITGADPYDFESTTIRAWCEDEPEMYNCYDLHQVHTTIPIHPYLKLLTLTLTSGLVQIQSRHVAVLRHLRSFR